MPARSGAVVIERPRLERMMREANVVLLEAPGGYGKSTAWLAWSRKLDVPTVRAVLRSRQDTRGLLASVAVAARRAGLPMISEAIDPEDAQRSLDRLIDRLQAAGSMLIGIDEAHRVDEIGAEWLAALCREVPAGQRVVIAGRRLAGPIRRLPEAIDAVLIDSNDLRFGTDEAAALLSQSRGTVQADAGDVAAILRATDGWPAALVLAARAESDPTSLRRADGGDGDSATAVFRHLVDRLVESGGRDMRALMGLVSQLPLLSTEAVDAVGGVGAMDRLLEAGLPIRLRPDGWAELPDPVRELFGAVRLEPGVVRIVAEHYADRGELTEAVGLLHRVGDHAAVAQLLAAQRRGVLGRSGLALFDAVVADIPDQTLAAHADAMVQLVRSADKMPKLRQRWIERGVSVLPEGTAARRAVAAEQALDLARGGDLDGASALAGTVISDAHADELTTIGRAHFCRGLCLILQDTAGATAAARDEFEIAISRFHLARERDWEAEALISLGYGVWFTSGALEAAADSIERALALRSASDAARSETLTVLAEVVTYMGRLDDAAVALREARAIAQRLGDERSLGYVAWSSAELGASRRDRDAAIAALEEAERHPGTWFGGLAGIDFLSHASEIRAVVGDVEGAWRDLERAETRAAGTSRDGEPLSARARLETMFGDPALGLRLIDEVELSPFAYPNDRWLQALMRAACLARLGTHDQARAHVRRARQLCAEQGDPERPARREPELLAIAEPGNTMTADPQPIVVAMGRFAVERGGQDASPPPGRPATLVKMLALRGQITIDEAIDELWPDADAETGRARLRNLLSRIKSSSGDLVVRTHGAVALAPGVEIDFRKFEEEAAAALSAPADTRAGLARAALARSTGELLPADRYADWATVPRERIRRRQIALLDLVSDNAIARGDFDEADRLLDEAITADPLDEMRYVRLARALLAQGRLPRARRVAEQAVAVADELGVEPADELAALLRELSAQV